MLRRVAGTSMLPTLRPGQLVWAWRWFRRLAPGDIIIVRHNGVEKIKRLAKLQTGQVFVVGDNQTHSTDSHEFGWLDTKAVIAKVVHS